MNIKVGITGQSGFIGTHLYNFLRTKNVERVNFDRRFFTSPSLLESFVGQCDAIVHLAGMSRSDNQHSLYDTNMELLEKLLTAAEETGNRPHILFGSTTHELKETPYHKSKRDGRRMIDDWADKNGAKSTALLMPNAFGPYSKPYFNSFVSTFCHKTAIGEKPEIILDSKVRLIYIETLSRHIYEAVISDKINPFIIPDEFEVTVSETAEKLLNFKSSLNSKIFPKTESEFDLRLLTTYLSYL